MQTETEVEVLSTRPLGTMVMAVFAPFVAIALMAAPLAIDALRHSLGL
jgi:hypothetical protein